MNGNTFENPKNFRRGGRNSESLREFRRWEVFYADVQPTDAEMSLYEKCTQITKEIPETLEMMKNYGGAAEAIRKVRGL